MLPVKVLVQTVVVARNTLQEQGRGARLPGFVTSIQKYRMACRIADSDAHVFVPAICDGGEVRIKLGAQLRDPIWKRIGKILVFTPTETVPSHHDPTAKMGVL